MDLVREVRAGDQAAFSELVRRHQRALYRLALRFAKDHGGAEDVVQESFIKAFQKIHTFEERGSFKSWLFRIAINTAKNKLRSRANDEVDIMDVTVSVDARSETDLQFKQVQGFVETLVDSLPERQRVALSLRVFEDLSFQEIAQIMECPYDTAKANYRHAVLKLKKALTDAGLADKMTSLTGSDEEGSSSATVENKNGP